MYTKIPSTKGRCIHTLVDSADDLLLLRVDALRCCPRAFLLTTIVVVIFFFASHLISSFTCIVPALLLLVAVVHCFSSSLHKSWLEEDSCVKKGKATCNYLKKSYLLLSCHPLSGPSITLPYTTLLIPRSDLLLLLLLCFC